MPFCTGTEVQFYTILMYLLFWRKMCCNVLLLLLIDLHVVMQLQISHNALILHLFELSVSDDQKCVLYYRNTTCFLEALINYQYAIEDHISSVSPAHEQKQSAYHDISMARLTSPFTHPAVFDKYSHARSHSHSNSHPVCESGMPTHHAEKTILNQMHFIKSN